MDLMRYDPFAEHQRIQEQMRHLFPNRTVPGIALHGPAVDVKETNSEVIVSAEIPGVDPHDLEVRISGRQLVISGETKQETADEREGYTLSERSYGSFYRTVPLPAEVNPAQAQASYKNGVLRISATKSERDRSTQVKIEVEPDKSPN